MMLYYATKSFCFPLRNYKFFTATVYPVSLADWNSERWQKADI